MSPQPTDDALRAPGIIAVKPTLDDMMQSRNILHFDPFGFFVQCWYVDLGKPLNPTASGSLFVYTVPDATKPGHKQPRCILGTDPAYPFRAQVQLATAPEGMPETWTAEAISTQELYLSLPKNLPWLEHDETFHLAGRHAVREAKPGDPREISADKSPTKPSQPAEV